VTKEVPDAGAALAGLADGHRIFVCGFGLSGNPEHLIAAVLDRGVRELELVSNNAGALGKGLATWLQAGIVARVVCSYVGTNTDLLDAIAGGKVDVEIVPQGTFAERIRAAGAGIPAFYTPTAAGTVLARGKETRVFDGREHVLEHALPGDFALIRAHRADTSGNLRFWRTSRNFAPAMAMAARVTVVETTEVVALGGLDPDDVHLPGAFVDRVWRVPGHEDVIEHRTVRARS
jgi:3-oxoacid CoA-transferase subunit A